MTKALGPDTPGLYDFDLQAIALAQKINGAATSAEVRAELTGVVNPDHEWAVIAGMASANTAELLRIIGHMADRIAATDERVEQLRGQLRDKSAECGTLRGQLRIATVGQVTR